MKIIAVDDDRISLDLLDECLTQGGYEHVTFLSSPSDVLARLTDTAIAYDCILLDVDMPGKDGIELCGEIRSQPRYRNTPIIMITKHKDHASVERAFANGATDYITKPFEFFEVLTRIRIAELLVRERQAAIDSYASIQQNTGKGTGAALLRSSPAKHLDEDARHPEIISDKIMSLSVFQNYVERVTRSDDSNTSLIAIKVCHVDRVFANTSAAEFVHFLQMVAVAISEEFPADRNVFMTHAGNGLFLCAGNVQPMRSVSEMARGIEQNLQIGALPEGRRMQVPVSIAVGDPLDLKPTAKLNFNRATKAAVARMEQRAHPIIEAKISAPVA